MSSVNVQRFNTITCGLTGAKTIPFQVRTNVFSRRFSSETSPTITVASFFSFSFSSDYNLTLIGPLFLQSKLLKLLP